MGRSPRSKNKSRFVSSLNFASGLWWPPFIDGNLLFLDAVIFCVLKSGFFLIQRLLNEIDESVK